jgi:ubiquinone/menaquinone biosynthesis C-methylase UbiE
MKLLRRLQFNLAYFGKAPWDSGISPPELYEFIQTHSAGRAIDLGCGTGTNVITLAKAGWQVTGIDFATRAIQIAKRKIRSAGVEADLRVGDVTRLDFMDTFDLALDIGCFHGVENRAAYLGQLARILTPGGFWLMYGFFQPSSNLAGPGLAAADLDGISAAGMTLLSRQDGFDKKERPSAWFLFQARPLVE